MTRLIFALLLATPALANPPPPSGVTLPLTCKFCGLTDFVTSICVRNHGHRTWPVNTRLRWVRTHTGQDGVVSLTAPLGPGQVATLNGIYPGAPANEVCRVSVIP